MQVRYRHSTADSECLYKVGRIHMFSRTHYTLIAYACANGGATKRPDTASDTSRSQVLGVRPNSSPAAIKQRYIALSKELHPDKLRSKTADVCLCVQLRLCADTFITCVVYPSSSKGYG